MKKTAFAPTAKHSFFAFAGSFFALVLLAILAANCTKSTPFGSDLLENEVADYHFTDTITVKCKVVRESRVISSDPNSTADYILCGKIDEPIFGKSEAEVYSLFSLTTLGPKFKKNNNPTAIDSIVMYLNVDSRGLYGDTTQRQTFRVFRVDAPFQIRWSKAYYSDTTMAATTEIGYAQNVVIRPNYRDSLGFGSGSDKLAIGKGNFIRIPLTKAFAEDIISYDSIDYTNDTLFWKKLRGIKITCETPNPSLISAFDLNKTDFSRVTVFYRRDGDTSQQRYHFNFIGGNKFAHFTHDYAGSEAQKHLDKPDNNLLFLQGMAGLKLEIDFPSARNWSNIIVNKAELEFTAVPDLVGDDVSRYWPASQLIFRDTSGFATSDVVYSAGSLLTGSFNLFGGAPKLATADSKSVYKYNMLMSDRFQDMVDEDPDDLKGTTIFMNIYPQSLSPWRAVLYGRNGAFPAKLKLKYTKL